MFVVTLTDCGCRLRECKATLTISHRPMLNCIRRWQNVSVTAEFTRRSRLQSVPTYSLRTLSFLERRKIVKATLKKAKRYTKSERTVRNVTVRSGVENTSLKYHVVIALIGGATRTRTTDTHASSSYTTRGRQRVLSASGTFYMRAEVAAVRQPGCARRASRLVAPLTIASASYLTGAIEMAAAWCGKKSPTVSEEP